jgi:sugar phosphate isomerase/epimerase
MKIAVTAVESAASTAPFVLRGPHRDTIRQAAQIGYDAVELHIANPAEIDGGELLRACDENRIAVSSIGTGLAFLRDGVTLTHQDEGIRRDAAHRLKAFIELGATLNSIVIVGLIKGQARDAGDLPTYETRFTEALEECLALAEHRKVTLVLEAMNRYESDVLNSISDCVQFIERFGSNSLKVHIDSFHMNIEEDRIRESILKAGSSIGHVHIADSNRRAPGSGHFDFSEMISALHDIDYKGVLSVECLGLPSPLEAAQSAYDFLRATL